MFALVYVIVAIMTGYGGVCIGSQSGYGRDTVRPANLCKHDELRSAAPAAAEFRECNLYEINGDSSFGPTQENTVRSGRRMNVEEPEDRQTKIEVNSFSRHSPHVHHSLRHRRRRRRRRMKSSISISMQASD